MFFHRIPILTTDFQQPVGNKQSFLAAGGYQGVTNLLLCLSNWGPSPTAKYSAMHKLWFKDSNVRLKITLQEEELLFKLYSHMHCSPGSGVKRSSPCQLPCTKSVQGQTENTEGKSSGNLQQMSGCCASCLLHALPSFLAPKLSWLVPEVRTMRTHLMKISCCGLHVQKGNSGQLHEIILLTLSGHYQDLLSGNCSAEFFYSLNQDKNQENSNNFFNYGVLRETAGCDSVIMQIMNFD